MRGPGARGLRCALCGALVCRSCSRVVRPSARIRLCGKCFQHRELSCPSGEWIYRELKTKFHDVTPSSSSESSLDVNMEVREFIERLTENLVSGSVDDVTVEPLSSHPQYEALCSQFHPRVQEILSRLAQSLQCAITEFPASKVACSGDSPSELHVQLKRLVVELREQAMRLPLLEMDCCREGDDTRDEGTVTSAAIDFSRRTYEDLLATAIINKEVESAQCVLMDQHLKTPTQPHTFISCMQIGVDDYEQQDGETRHSEHLMEKIIQETRREEDEDSYLGSPEDTSPDEETTEHVTRRTRTRRRVGGRGVSADMQKFLDGLKYSHRVPFPELGADIVEGSVQESLLEETARTTLYLVNSDSHHSSLSSASWEENWLFQRRRLRIAPTTPRPKVDEGRVPMLVPNPRAEDSHVRAKVGDMDADQLSSDLSDYESYMSREDGWSEQDSLDSAGRQGDFALGRLLCSSEQPSLIEATNQEVGATLILGPQSNGTESEFDQQEGEYLEDFASIGQRSLSSLQEAMQASLVAEASQVPDVLDSATLQQQEAAARDAASQQQPQEKNEETELPDAHIDENEEDRLAAPPRPGTIAEREHLKWQQARPMANNPYSEESIAKRLGRRQRAALRDSGPASLPVQGTGDLEQAHKQDSTPQRPLRINCSAGQTVDFKQYGRDYYINEIRSAKKMDNNETSCESTGDGVMPSEPASLEDQTALSASLTSLDDRADSAVGSTASAASFEDSEPVKMPSVRELAKQFTPPAPPNQRQGAKRAQNSSKNTLQNAFKSEKSIVIVELSSSNSTKAPTPAPVHSLTARNLSKEFRAGLRGEGKVPENGSSTPASEAPPRPAERHRANLEFWRSLDPPTPAPRNLKKTK